HRKGVDDGRESGMRLDRRACGGRHYPVEARRQKFRFLNICLEINSGFSLKLRDRASKFHGNFQTSSREFLLI
ncbi:hypothetical protein HAX54_014496, partial [Datura stramonium]|nr:hypothetical protein [Datura stramonium]